MKSFFKTLRHSRNNQPLQPETSKSPPSQTSPETSDNEEEFAYLREIMAQNAAASTLKSTSTLPTLPPAPAFGPAIALAAMSSDLYRLSLDLSNLSTDLQELTTTTAAAITTRQHPPPYDMHEGVPSSPPPIHPRPGRVLDGACPAADFPLISSAIHTAASAAVSPNERIPAAHYVAAAISLAAECIANLPATLPACDPDALLAAATAISTALARAVDTIGTKVVASYPKLLSSVAMSVGVASRDFVEARAQVYAGRPESAALNIAFPHTFMYTRKLILLMRKDAVLAVCAILQTALAHVMKAVAATPAPSMMPLAETYAAHAHATARDVAQQVSGSRLSGTRMAAGAGIMKAPPNEWTSSSSG